MVFVRKKNKLLSSIPKAFAKFFFDAGNLVAYILGFCCYYFFDKNEFSIFFCFQFFRLILIIVIHICIACGAKLSFPSVFVSSDILESAFSRNKEGQMLPVKSKTDIVRPLFAAEMEVVFY